MDETNKDPLDNNDKLSEAFSYSPVPDSPDKEAVEARLREEYAKYQQALEQEWETGVAYEKGELTPTQIRDKTRELLTQGVPKAVASMLHLAQHARSEQVQMGAAKFIIERAIGKEGTGLVGDPLETLLAKMHSDNSE
jgi:hypothetical protein